MFKTGSRRCSTLQALSPNLAQPEGIGRHLSPWLPNRPQFTRELRAVFFMVSVRIMQGHAEHVSEDDRIGNGTATFRRHVQDAVCFGVAVAGLRSLWIRLATKRDSSPAHVYR